MRSLLKSIATGVCAFALVSCAGGGTNGRLAQNLDVVPGAQEPGEHDPVAKAAFWGTRYDREPANASVAVKFSSALRNLGSNEESLKVMSRTFAENGENADVSLEYGKSLIANDRAFEAVRPLERAIQLGKGNDWRTYSAYGVALDKIGEHRSARTQYDLALKLSPDNAAIMNNKGLSYALSGELGRAENVLRTAAGSPKGTPTVRQNLALVLGFKGDTAEAERLARSDLPPRIANNNVAYFRSLVTQPAYWQEFSGDNVELPSFDAPAAAVAPVEAGPVQDIPASAPPTTLRPAPVDEAPEELRVPTPEPKQPKTDPEVLSSVKGQSGVGDASTVAAFGDDSWSSINPPATTKRPTPLENTSASENDEAADQGERPDEDDADA